MSLVVAFDNKTNGTQTVYTVTTAKVLLLYSVHLEVINTGSNLGNGAVKIYDDSPAEVGPIIRNKALPGETISESINFSPPLSLPEDYTIRAWSDDADTEVFVSITGLEV
jgi:hypothetical protein